MNESQDILISETLHSAMSAALTNQEFASKGANFLKKLYSDTYVELTAARRAPDDPIGYSEEVEEVLDGVIISTMYRLIDKCRYFRWSLKELPLEEVMVEYNTILERSYFLHNKALYKFIAETLAAEEGVAPLAWLGCYPHSVVLKSAKCP